MIIVAWKGNNFTDIQEVMEKKLKCLSDYLIF